MRQQFNKNCPLLGLQYFTGGLQPIPGANFHQFYKRRFKHWKMYTQTQIVRVYFIGEKLFQLILQYFCGNFPFSIGDGEFWGGNIALYDCSGLYSCNNTANTCCRAVQGICQQVGAALHTALSGRHRSRYVIINLSKGMSLQDGTIIDPEKKSAASRISN